MTRAEQLKRRMEQRESNAIVESYKRVEDSSRTLQRLATFRANVLADKANRLDREITIARELAEVGGLLAQYAIAKKRQVREKIREMERQ